MQQTFKFDLSLGHGQYVPFELPAVGQSTVIEAVPFSLITPPGRDTER